MSRELYIDQYTSFSKLVTTEEIVKRLNENFLLKSSELLDVIVPAFVQDKFDLKKYTKLCQYLDAFTFAYGSITTAHAVALIFIGLDINGNMMLKISDAKKYFLSVTPKEKAKQVKKLVDAANATSDNYYSIDEFLAVYQVVKESVLDKEVITAIVNTWSFAILFSQFANGQNYLTDENAVKAIQKQFSITNASVLSVVVKLVDTSKVHKFNQSEFTYLCSQILFVTQKVGTSNFSLNVVAFRILDINCSGFLNPKEFSRFLRKSGLDTKKESVKETIKKLDTNGDGVLQIDEFIVLTNGLSKSDVPKYFLNNLVAKSQSDLKFDSVQPQNQLKNVRTLQSEKKECSKLIRKTVERPEFVAMFKELCPSEKMDLPTLKIAIEKVIGESNTKALKGAMEVIFKVGNIDCDDKLDCDEFVILISAIEQCMRGKVIEERDMYEVFFHIADGDHDGLIDCNELAFLVQQIDGTTLSHEDAEDLVRSYDEGGKNQLSLDEYMCYFMQLDQVKLDDTEEEKDRKAKKQIKKTFRLIDKDSSNSLELSEVVKYIVSIVGELPETNYMCLKAMFYVCDENKDDKLSESEFIQFFCLFEYYIDDDGQFDLDSIYIELFSMMDKDKTDKLSKKVITEFLGKIGWKESAINFMEKYDSDHSDSIGLNEFVLAFCGKNIDTDDI
ncbi:calmodulin, putative [Entamoeba invadens IP1]|uniref:calmodulin, putative n=1 Tax=Entamoeba invadens IP1 TaxID=370355 RepID=UPI0002C3F693|nr:calmodulin, putative [Entamoeba invadens IP1]ELP93821.1 calmodulin, putative [Entamoeba invadens IP1]|eukprot:XP_004260592.1 calmodulin, putative [Entamoeba invadens IP1]